MIKGRLEADEIYEMYADNINYYAAPGTPLNRIALFAGKKVYTDVGTYEGADVAEYINKDVASWVLMSGIQCSGIDHGSWLRDRDYCDIKEIEKKKEDDYYFNTDILNYAQAVMVAANDYCKGKDGITLIEYCGEADMTVIHEFKDKLAFIKYAREFLDEIEE